MIRSDVGAFVGYLLVGISALYFIGQVIRWAI